MSELDEINPPDAISENPQFFEAARQFISVVESSNAPRRGRAFAEHLQTCFSNVHIASQPEFEQLDQSMRLIE